MKSKLTILSFLFFIFLSHGQQVQWASKIIKMPSDLGGKQYGIKRILGKPDAFPQAGSSPNAWSPKNSLKSRDVLEVGFEKPQTVKQVAIFENLNAGSVEKISVADASGNYQVVWNRQYNYVTPPYRFRIYFGNTQHSWRKNFKTQQAPDVSFNPGVETAILETPLENIIAVKIHFNFALKVGQKQIDAVGISDSDSPLEAKINTSSQLENIEKSETINAGALIPNEPLVSHDGAKLYVTNNQFSNSSTDDFIEKIYSFSKNTNGIWDNPVEESASLNANMKYNFLDAHYQNFIVRGGRPTKIGSPECGYDILENMPTYNQLETIKIAGFNNYNATCDMTIAEDKKTILMAIESDFSQGGSDIYVTTKKDDGTYGLLQNAGKIINSAADEVNIQMLSDQKTLLFSSDGFSGYGSFDIYTTHRLDDTWKNWSEPLNLGNKINTNDLEGAPFYDEKSQILYYTSFENEKKVLKKVNIARSILMLK